MKALTKRQQEILDFLKKFIKDHKYPPTIREIAGNFSISVKGAYDHVKALEKKEQIKCDLGRSRAIEIVGDDVENRDLVEVPLIGHVAAGIPLFAEENWEERPFDMYARFLLAAECYMFVLIMLKESVLQGNIASGCEKR